MGQPEAVGDSSLLGGFCGAEATSPLKGLGDKPVGWDDWVEMNFELNLTLSERLMPPPKLPGAAFLCQGTSFTLRLAHFSLWAFDKVE